VLSSVLDLVLDGAPEVRSVMPAGPVGRIDAIAVSERDLRAFYDPAGRCRRRSAEILLDDVAATRVPFVLSPVGRLSGYEVILAEAVHAGLRTRPAAGPAPLHTVGAHSDGVVLPIPPGRQHAIAAAVDDYADTVAAAVLEVADELGHDLRRLRERIAGLDRQVDSERLVLAGRVLAAVAHDGVVRRSGRDYYCHLDEVASILSAAWRRQGHPEQDPRLQIGRFLAYCHDGFEDSLDPRGGYLSELPVIVSPRVARAVLEDLAVPDAAEVARVLLLLTRTRAVDGSRMDYLDYLERGIAEGGAYFVLTKAGDVHHNLSIEPEDIDPADQRAPTRYEKRELYRSAANRLRGAADGHDHGIAWTIHTTFTVRPAELGPSLRSDTASVHRLAATVREKVRKAQESAVERRDLAHALVRDGYSQADLARELGVTRQAIQKMMSI
jgi:hypothetical protein